MKVRGRKKRSFRRPGRNTLLVIVGLALAALAWHLGWHIDLAPFEWQYTRLHIALACVFGAVSLFTLAIVTHLDPPDGELFSPEFRRLAWERRTERLEMRKRHQRIRDIMRYEVGNPEDDDHD